MTPGATYTVTVGSGSTAAGSPGGDSWFSLNTLGNATVLAKGGASVANDTTTGGSGGAAADGTGDVRRSGGDGADAGSNYGGGGGSSAGMDSNGNNGSGSTGGVAPAGGGNGGAGRSGSQGNGTAGIVPGGGGGGAYRSGSGGGSPTGGNGANGQVIVTYAMPVTQTYNANGDFVVPPGVTTIIVEAWGGGGGGGTASGRQAGAGGGAYAISTLAVSPGQSYVVAVGSGGAPGQVGGNSVFGSDLVKAAGGQNSSDGTAGAGGTVAASIGDVRYAGGAGGGRSSNAGGGGGGSATATAAGGTGFAGSGNTGGSGGAGAGAGGAGGSQNSSGQSGLAPGGGGGGKGSGTSSVSGSGAAGRVRVTYLQTLIGETGAAPNLASGWTIMPGEVLTLTYQVKVDGPPVTVSDIVNRAWISSDDYPDPLPVETATPVDEAYLAWIGDLVWHDFNGNGLQDAGEPGLPGVGLGLYRVTAGEGPALATNLIATVVTDGNGNYSFGRLPPGNYLVKTSVPADFDPVPAGAGGDAARDSNGDADGWSGVVSVTGGQTDNSVDFGYHQPARLFGYAYWDKDLSLTRNAGDGAASNMIVELWLDGVMVGTTNAAANGYYEFGSLVPGLYEVRFMGSVPHLTATPPTGSAAAGDEERNRAEPSGTYGVLTYNVVPGYGMVFPGEPLNAGFTGGGPLSSGIDLRAYAAADGAYVEFVAYDVEQDGEAWLLVVDGHGNVVGDVTVPLQQGARQVVRFRVPKLEVGQRYDFHILDEVGKYWQVSDLEVRPFAMRMVRMSLAGITLSFESIPDRNYEIQWTPKLGTPWRAVTNIPSRGSRTETLVKHPDPSSPSGFFRVRVK